MEENPDTLSQVLVLLKENPRGLNIREISQAIGVNRMSVAKYLEVLTAVGTVEVRTMGSSKIYHLSRRIPLSAFLKHTFRYYFVIDENMQIIQLNEEVSPVVQLAPEEMIGKQVHHVIGKRIVNAEECEQSIARALDGEENALVIEDRFDDRVTYFGLTNTPIEFPDGSRGVLITSEDVTEKKLLEISLREQWETYRSLVEQGPDIVFSVNPGGCLTYVGPQVGRYGFLPEELTGLPVDRLIHPDDRDAVMARFPAAGTAREPVPGIPFRVVVPDGHAVWFEPNCMARQDTSGACAGISGTLRDITTRAGTGRADKTRKK